LSGPVGFDASTRMLTGNAAVFADGRLVAAGGP
jgi:hypothetical protein